MNRILILLAMLVVENVYALPPCPSSGMFHNCFGTLLKDGSEYVGEWQDGRPNGQGTDSGVNGDKYFGEWKDGKYQGQGMMTWPSGEKYVGEFKDNLRHAQGTLTWPDGRKLVGEFISDRPWTGILYDSNGNVFSKYQDGVEIKQE